MPSVIFGNHAKHLTVCAPLPQLLLPFLLLLPAQPEAARPIPRASHFAPAVVPPIVLTTAKIAIVVSEPIITGNSIVKLYKVVPAPKIW